MTTRREVLVGGLIAGAAGLLRGVDTLFAKGAQPATKVNFEVPPGACDCHVHVFGDPVRYPFSTDRTYTPDAATSDELEKLLAALRLDRVIVVQASVYGTDNTCTLDSIRHFGARARGVAVIDASTTDATLDRMAKSGIRGIRLNLSQVGITDPAQGLQAFQEAATRASTRGWHVQFNTSLKMIDALAPKLLASPVPVVFDHFGGARGAAGVDQPGFAALVSLVRSGKAYVKISGAGDQTSTNPPVYAEAQPLARALVAANPQRVLWGSSWPHPGSTPGGKRTDLSPNKQVDDGLVLNFLPAWVPDAATRKLILVDNPARLYGFQ
ncbi:MAG: amidohydrolase family protein [Vicinamibacterales bacterium]|nr:amidohydrolase family protein [Vicinamibacterales bacterium]